MGRDPREETTLGPRGCQEHFLLFLSLFPWGIRQNADRALPSPAANESYRQTALQPVPRKGFVLGLNEPDGKPVLRRARPRVVKAGSQENACKVADTRAGARRLH